MDQLSGSADAGRGLQRLGRATAAEVQTRECGGLRSTGWSERQSEATAIPRSTSSRPSRNFANGARFERYAGGVVGRAACPIASGVMVWVPPMRHEPEATMSTGNRRDP